MIKEYVPDVGVSASLKLVQSTCVEPAPKAMRSDLGSHGGRNTSALTKSETSEVHGLRQPRVNWVQWSVGRHLYGRAIKWGTWWREMSEIEGKRGNEQITVRAQW